MAIEWGFLILLAVGAGIARSHGDLNAWEIALVMAVGWVLVVLVELLAWRARPAYAVAEVDSGTPPVAGPPEVTLEEPPPPAYDFEFTPPAPSEAPEPPAVEPAEPAAVAEEPEPVSKGAAPEEQAEEPAIASDDPYAPAPERESLKEAEQRVSYRLEPLKPRPRRRWFRRGNTPGPGES